MALLSFILYQDLEKIGDRNVLQDALRRAFLSTPLVPYSAAWSAHDLYERARLSVCLSVYCKLEINVNNREHRIS